MNNDRMNEIIKKAAEMNDSRREQSIQNAKETLFNALNERKSEIVSGVVDAQPTLPEISFDFTEPSKTKSTKRIVTTIKKFFK